MNAPLLLQLFSRSPFALRLMLLEMLTSPKKSEIRFDKSDVQSPRK